jgi:hypothetical protein
MMALENVFFSLAEAKSAKAFKRTQPKLGWFIISLLANMAMDHSLFSSVKFRLKPSIFSGDFQARILHGSRWGWIFLEGDKGYF